VWRRWCYVAPDVVRRKALVSKYQKKRVRSGECVCALAGRRTSLERKRPKNLSIAPRAVVPPLPPPPPRANILKRVPLHYWIMLQSIKFALSASPICFANAAIAARLLSGERTKREVVPLGQINHKAGNFACSHSPDCPFSLAATAKTQAAPRARPSFVCCVKFMYNSSASVRFSQRAKRRFVRIQRQNVVKDPRLHPSAITGPEESH
jgi:hypothetical protein